MAIDEEKLRWASSLEVDPENGLDNKVEPSTELKTSGIKRNQPIARQWLNWQMDQTYIALKDLQQQIETLTTTTSQPTLETIYPVGSLYLSYVSSSPDTLLGFGTWVRVKGKFLIGVDEADVDFDAPAETGGSKTHTHSNNLSVDGHILTVGELPATNPVSLTVTTAGSASTSAGSINPLAGDEELSTSSTSNVTWAGNDEPHTHGLSGGVQSATNMPPYEAIYIWRRTV